MIGGMANNTNIGTSIVTGQIWLVFITGNHNLTLVRHHYPVIVKVVVFPYRLAYYFFVTTIL